MKAQVIYKHKSELQGRFVLELTIHNVGNSLRYPDGVKYSLICFDRESKNFVLFDNHHPKGHHRHINNKEYAYEYVSDEQLVEDFNRAVYDQMGVKI